MSFYWSINNIGSNTINMRELYDIYRDAMAEDSMVDWERLEASADAVLGGNAQFQRILVSGADTGVNNDTSVLP